MEQKLRSGYTTGLCAAAAAKAAAFMLWGEENRKTTEVTAKNGETVSLLIENRGKTGNRTGCCVRKDAGDDPDVTDQALIWAWAEPVKESPLPQWYTNEDYPGIYIEGGKGIGRVTRPGLSCPVGKAAINPVPREMIWEAVEEVRRILKRDEPVLVTVEIPEGEELAKKTFNPKLGITGGLSVLGTTGIVKPMSEEALIATIHLEIHMKAVEGDTYLVLTPGNYGENFLKQQFGLSLEHGVKYSNFIKDTVKFMADEGFSRGLLIGHVGKLIKAAGGAENTHSRFGDNRMETILQCVEESGKIGTQEKNRDYRDRILESNTTEEAVCYLESLGIRRRVGDYGARLLQKQILTWTEGRLLMDVIMFSNELGIFGEAVVADGKMDEVIT